MLLIFNPGIIEIKHIVLKYLFNFIKFAITLLFQIIYELEKQTENAKIKILLEILQIRIA